MRIIKSKLSNEDSISGLCVRAIISQSLFLDAILFAIYNEIFAGTCFIYPLNYFSISHLSSLDIAHKAKTSYRSDLYVDLGLVF